MKQYLSRLEFDILQTIIESPGAKTQRVLGAEIQKSPATVNRIIKNLEDGGLLYNGKITERGYGVMEQYRVKRAIFIAAGFGSRMVPITLNTPKPLVRVNGVRIIDTLLDAVVAAGIEEIYIVRGYLAEQFDQLLYKYPMIRFLDNPEFNEANNISSALYAKDLFCNAYVFEADVLLKKPSLISQYQYTCNYLGFPVERTDDWCVEVRNKQITSMKLGGTNCYQMIGISYWNEEAGKKLSEDILQAVNLPGGREKLWDTVPLETFKKHYAVEVRPCSPDDVVEIDTFKELKQLDNTYSL